TINDVSDATRAYATGGAGVQANHVIISAADSFNPVLGAGGIAYGGTAGESAANSTLLRDGTVDASVGPNTSITAKFGLAVTATESESFILVAIGGGGANGMAVAGS